MRIVVGSATPTITSGSAYSAGQCLGGMLTFTKVDDFGFGTVLTVSVIDKSDQKSAIDVLLFNQPLASPPSDKTSASIAAADMANYIGHVSFVSGDYTDGVASAGAVKYNLWMACAGGVDNNIYGLVICRGTPTYTSTSAITVKVTAQVDKDQ